MNPPGPPAAWLDDQEIESLLSPLESDRVECKRTAGDRRAIRRTTCAFANDLPGYGRPGVIVVGLEDDGRCAGLTVDDALLRTLAQMRDDGHILLRPSMVVQRRRILGCDVAVVQVAPANAPPVRLNGRVWVRVGPTTREATPDEERRPAERRRAGDRPFDMRPVAEANIDELDLDYARTPYVP